MSIPTVPTILEIKNRIITDVEGKINQTTPALPKGFVRVLAGALAGMIVLLYIAIMWVYKQIFPHTADYESLILAGSIVNIRPKVESTAIILCTVPGTGDSVAKGITFISSNGIVYQVTTTTSITAGRALNVPMQALTAGEISNLANGEILNIAQTDLSLEGTATVTGTQTSGADIENKELFRKHVIARYRRRATGGSPFDYYLWGIECPNFIWVGPYNDTTITNKINVYGKVGNQTNGIPTASQLAQLLNYLKYDPESGKANRAPMGDLQETFPCSIHLFDVAVTIRNTGPDIQAEITQAIGDYIKSFEPYIEGVSDKKNNMLTTSNVSNVASDVAESEGATVISVVITNVVTGQPIVDNRYSFIGGEFGMLRNITFTAV